MFNRSCSGGNCPLTVAVGAPYNDGNGVSSRHVRVFDFVANEWEQLGEDIDGEAPGENSGKSISLSADGTTLAVGADVSVKYEIGRYGRVRVYEIDRSSGSQINWEKIGQELVGGVRGGYFGTSLTLCADGKTLADGAPGSNSTGINAGMVKVFNID